MIVFAVLAAVAVVAVFGALHWYLWRRLVAATTVPGSPVRRAGKVFFIAAPILALGAMAGESLPVPLIVKSILAWPGYLWLALFLYLLLGVLVGEVVRPLLTRWLARRDAAPATAVPTAAASDHPVAGNAVAGNAVAKSALADGTVAEAPAGSTVVANIAVMDAPVGAPAIPGGASAIPAGVPAIPVGEPATLASTPVVPAGAPAIPTAAHTVPVGEPAILAGAPVVPASAPVISAGTPSIPAGAPGAPVEAVVVPVDDPAVQPGESVVPAGASGAGDRPAGTPALLSRRLFVSRVVGGVAAAAAVGTVGYGAWDVLNGPAVRRVTVPLAKLPRAAHGFRIAVVSDVHLSAVLGRGFAQRVTDTINATQPDLIAVVGDLVDGNVDELADSVEPLRGLRSRHGTFFVTGNHEYFSGADEWVEKVRELGWQPLENARTAMPGFDLAGVNDVAGESSGDGPDFGKALGDRDPARAAVLLAHQPVVIHDAVRYGVDLQLSGHTHGGQMWPATFIAGAANPTLAGLEPYGDTQLYVSRGAGAWGPPVRVGAPSDVTIVQLASRQA